MNKKAKYAIVGSAALAAAFLVSYSLTESYRSQFGTTRPVPPDGTRQATVCAPSDQHVETLEEVPDFTVSNVRYLCADSETLCFTLDATNHGTVAVRYSTYVTYVDGAPDESEIVPCD